MMLQVLQPCIFSTLLSLKDALLPPPVSLPRRFGTVNRVQLNVAPGYQNAFKFGLVEMGSPAEAQAAHEALHVSRRARVLPVCCSQPRRHCLQRLNAAVACTLGSGPPLHTWNLGMRPRRCIAPPPVLPLPCPSPAVPQGSPSETICSTKPLKLRYGWPRRLVRPAGVWGSSSVSDGGAEPDSSAATAAAVTAAAAAEAAFCCAACGAGDVSQLKRCSGCRAVSFCSRECQVKAWQGEHDARACGRLAQLGRLLGSMPASDGEQAGQQLPPEALRLLLTALLQPGTRQGRMVRAAMASARPPAGPPAGPPPLAAA